VSLELKTIVKEKGRERKKEEDEMDVTKWEFKE